MEKNFDQWNTEKQKLETKTQKYLFKNGDVWWMSIGINIGSESCGKGKTSRRPVLVLRKLSSNSFIGLPLTTKEKQGSWFCDITIDSQVQHVLLYQIRMFHTSRFQRRLTTLDDGDFNRVKEKLEALLELSDNHQRRSTGSVGNPKSN